MLEEIFYRVGRKLIDPGLHKYFSRPTVLADDGKYIKRSQIEINLFNTNFISPKAVVNATNMQFILRKQFFKAKNGILAREVSLYFGEKKLYSQVDISQTEIEIYHEDQKIKTIDKLEDFKTRFMYHIPSDCDGVYFLRRAYGDVYQFLKYHYTIHLSKNSIKRPFFLLAKKGYADILLSFIPDARYAFVDDIHYAYFPDESIIDGKKIFMIYKVNRDGSTDLRGHMLEFWSRKLKIELKSEAILYPIVSNKFNISLFQKISKTNLNLSNFIFVVPEARSMRSMSLEFWLELIRAYKVEGYDVFINTTLNGAVEAGAVFCDLSINEAFVLASFAKTIISARTGLSEYFMESKTPLIFLYPYSRPQYSLNGFIDCNKYIYKEILFSNDDEVIKECLNFSQENATDKSIYIPSIKTNDEVGLFSAQNAKLTKENDDLSNKLNLALAALSKAKNTKNHLSYQLGYAIVSAYKSKNIIKILSIPFSLYKIKRNFKNLEKKGN